MYAASLAIGGHVNFPCLLLRINRDDTQNRSRVTPPYQNITLPIVNHCPHQGELVACIGLRGVTKTIAEYTHSMPFFQLLSPGTAVSVPNFTRFEGGGWVTLLQ